VKLNLCMASNQASTIWSDLVSIYNPLFSSQRRCATIHHVRQGPIAQRLEQGAHNSLAAGSIPAGPTHNLYSSSRIFQLSLSRALPTGRSKRKMTLAEPRSGSASVIFLFEQGEALRILRGRRELKKPLLLHAGVVETLLWRWLCYGYERMFAHRSFARRAK
jgi:hypothetical protein